MLKTNLLKLKLLASFCGEHKKSCFYISTNYRFFPSFFPDEARQVMVQYIWALYKDRKFDQRGREILGELTRRLSGPLPSNKREWIEFYKGNLKLTKELAPRIKNPILRKALEDRNRDTEKLLKKLESGQGTQKDISEYNARTIRKLKQALEEYRKGGRQTETE